MSSKELIIAACEKGDLSQLQHVLAETELNVGSEPLGSEGETTLHVACAHGHLDIVQYLVNDRGCSVTIPNSRAVGVTPLVVAWANKHWKVVELLLNAIQEKELYAEVGLAQITVTRLQEVAKYGDEALHQACIHGYLEVVKYLMCSGYQYLLNETGHNPTAVSSHGTTPLQVAWENRHWEVASYLLQAMKKYPGHVSSLSLTTITQLLKVLAFRELALHVACSQGLLKVVKYLYESLKCNLTQRNSQGKTPLDLARSSGHLHVIHYLLESGMCSVSDMTELHIACMRKDKNKVENLASDIACLKKADQYGITAVHYATYQPENLCILVSIAEQRKLSVLNRKDRRGNTPLHYAASCGCTESVKILVSNYKSVNMQNSDGNTPLHLSIKGGYHSPDLVREIILHKSCNLHAMNEQNETPLHIASECGDLDSAELLLLTGKCGSGDVQEAIECQFLLHQAVALSNLDLVQTLLQVPGCNINRFNSDGETPLHVACRSDIMVFELLTADSRCDLNAQNKNGLTALHITIASGDLRKYHLLITNVDCNPNILCSEGSTALHMMTEKNMGRSLSVLLNNPKCNPNMKNKEGNCALHIAVRKNSVLSATSLLQHDRIDPNILNEIGNTPLHEAVISKASIAVVECLIQHKECNPCIKNFDGKTPLQIASKKRLLQYFITFMACGKCSQEEIRDAASRFKFLLHYTISLNDITLLENVQCTMNCDVNEANEDGETPLHVACRQCGTEILEMLVADKRFDLNVQNNAGDTALHIAVYSELHSAQKVQSILHSERCNPNITNNERCTPLHVAVRRRKFEVSTVLLRYSRINPNVQENEDHTCLHMSISSMSLSIDLNIKNMEGNTPLHEAVMSPTPVDVVEALTLHKSCNPSIVNNAGMTPLQISTDLCELDYAEVLITSGKCSNEDIVKATESACLLHQAVSSNRLGLALMLIEIQDYNLNKPNSDGETPLHVACRAKCSNLILKKLVEDSRCDLNAQNIHGNTASHIAIFGVSEGAEKVQCIAQSERYNPNIINVNEHTPLHIAVIRKDFQSAAIVLKHLKCNPNIQNISGNTPLHIAIISNISLPSVQPFLNHKDIDLNMQNKEGNTPLHEAVMRQIPVDVVEALILHKTCNPSIVNNAGMTPLKISVTSSELDYAEVLITSAKYSHEDIAKATEGTLLLHKAVSLNRPKLVLKLIKVKDYNINETDSVGETALHLACRMHNNTVIQRMVENRRFDLNVQNQCGETALHLVMYSKSEVAEKVQCILQSERCNSNITNDMGHTPLHVAIKENQFQSAAILLKHSKCNPNIQDLSGTTPLHMAIICNMSLSSIEPILNHNSIDLNIQNIQGNTPLHEAVKTGVPVDVIVAFTLHKACNPSVVNNAGMTPLKISVTSGELDYVEALITSGKFSHEDIVKATEGACLLHQALSSNRHKLVLKLIKIKDYNVNETDFAEETALHIACKMRSKALMQRMVNNSRFDLNAQNQCGDTALHLALYSKWDVAEKVQCILQSERCNLNTPNSKGYTPLHVAVIRKEFQSAAILLKHSKCNPNIQDLSGNTPLHLAIHKLSLSTVESFLNHKCIQLNIQNRVGNTALHEALMRQTPLDIVEALTLHKCCNPSIVNNAGMTPLQISVGFGELNYVESLITSGKCSHEDIVKATKGTLFLHQAVSSNRPRLVLRLIDVQEWNINETDSAGETPLHVACRTKNSKFILEKLVEDSRCNLNTQNEIGNTALHIAIYSGTEVVDKVQCIIQSERCNPNITNKKGYTPLHVAANKMEFHTFPIILKHSQCNPNLQTFTGNTPLHLSVGKMLLSDVECFLNHDMLNLDIQNQHGETILLKAVIGETPVDVVKALTHHKSCNPSLANDEGITPLQNAIIQRKMGHVEALITSGKCSHEDIVMAVEDKCLLYQAVVLQQVDLFWALINLQECNAMSKGEKLLHIACKTRYCKRIMELLVEKCRCDLNAQNTSGDTALHIAISSEYNNAEKVQCILKNERCNPNILNCKGFTPLYVAVKNKRFQSAAMLLEHSSCNPNIQDLRGNTALHFCIGSISLSLVKLFLMNRHINLSIQNNAGDTVLHIAVMRQRPLDVVRALICHESCNLCLVNTQGMTPLQTAMGSQQMDIAAALITSKKCNHGDIVKATKEVPLLFHVILQEKAEILTALIETGVSINVSNSKGQTALHAACEKRNSKATELLLQNGADVHSVDWKGNAPIHVACAHMALRCLNLLLRHNPCNPNQQNAVGDTPLHILCSYGQSCDMRMLRILLSAPGINPECVNHAGQIPAELAKSNYFVIEMITKYLEHRTTHLETYLKIFVVGNSGGGKSTLIKAVTTERSKTLTSTFSFRANLVNPSDVLPHTAGIVPLSFNSKHFGHAVLYDFAGQHEYYSSHAAVMENLVLPSPPLFLLLIDISKPMDEIREELLYWWMFISNHSKRATAPPHVILVGSHKDIVKERGENVQRTMGQIRDIVRNIPALFQFDHSKVFPLDCRKLVSKNLAALLTQLKLTCQSLRQSVDIDLHCHILKAFLGTKFPSSVACEVSEIADKMKSEDVLLPQESSQLIPLLSTLSDKGYILLLHNHIDVNKSWVVLKPELLLAEVNGSIFAPDNFKEHCSGFTMSTGVVTLSKIQERFGKFDHQVIIGYLTHLEFCFRIKDQHTLEMITKGATLQLTAQGSGYEEEYYFFPALIWKENPSDVCQPQETISYECGWLYRCNEPTEQLTTRFLHVLILRLAFSCDPPDEPTQGESVVLLRSCSVWKHGIAWWTNDGIETIVEVGLQCRWVVVMLRCPDTHKVQCAELRTKVISTVLKTKQDFCPAISMKEFLIAPSSLQYPFEGRELTLYSMREIAKVVIAGKEFPKDTGGKSTIHISQLLPFEPFFNFGEDLMDNLFTVDQSETCEISRHIMFQIANKCFNKLDDFMKAIQPIPNAFQRECVKPDCTEVERCVALFQILQRRGCKTWRDFEQEFSKFSIFCSRNPMDLALERESEFRYPHEHPMISANFVTKHEEVLEMAEKDHVSAEGKNSTNTEMPVKKSVKERGKEDGKARGQEREKDIKSQEVEMEQSFESHSDTGEMKKETEIGTKCALHGDIVESSKNAHRVEVISAVLKSETLANHMADLEIKNGVHEFEDVKEKDGTVKELNHDASHKKANTPLVKQLTHSGSDCPMTSEERLAERREPLDVGTKQEMDLQTREELRVLQEMNKKEERPKEYPLMHTAAARAYATTEEETLEREENGQEAYQTEEEERDVTAVQCSDDTADARSEKVGEGQICQGNIQGIMSTEDREESIEDSHTHTAAEKPVTEEKLSLKVLTNEVVPEVCSKWYLLGIQLNLSDKVLDQIEMDHPRDLGNMKCCIKMFSEWLSQDAGVSWSTLMAALSSKAIAENELAVKLQEILH